MTEDVSAPKSEESGRSPLVVEVVQVTDVGLVRTENQDFAMLGPAERELATDGRGRLMIVADGMGGHRGGATASKLAATTIVDLYSKSEDKDPSVALRHAMEQANALIFNEAQNNPDLRGMGTTCSALVIKGRQGYFTHVGDSRIYLVRGGEIRQLTEDHSLVASMVREGLLTSQEAEVHPRRNVLQRSMGVGEFVEIDVSPPFEVMSGDTFILCSDGLHGLVKPDELKEIAPLSIEEAAREYVRRAIERGAPDNVTVIVARAIESGIPTEKPAAPVPPTVEEERPEWDATTKKLPVVRRETPAPQTAEVDSEAEQDSRIPLWFWIGLLLIMVAGGALLIFRNPF